MHSCVKGSAMCSFDNVFPISFSHYFEETLLNQLDDTSYGTLLAFAYPYFSYHREYVHASLSEN